MARAANPGNRGQRRSGKPRDQRPARVGWSVSSAKVRGWLARAIGRRDVDAMRLAVRDCEWSGYGLLGRLVGWLGG